MDKDSVAEAARKLATTLQVFADIYERSDMDGRRASVRTALVALGQATAELAMGLPD